MYLCYTALYLSFFTHFVEKNNIFWCWIIYILRMFWLEFFLNKLNSQDGNQNSLDRVRTSGRRGEGIQ